LERRGEERREEGRRGDERREKPFKIELNTSRKQTYTFETYSSRDNTSASQSGSEAKHFGHSSPSPSSKEAPGRPGSG